MDSPLEGRLMEALAALERGESSALVLARFPEDAAALTPLLEVAELLPGLAPAPRPAAQAASRRAFLEGAAALAAVPTPPWWRRAVRRRDLAPRKAPRAALSLAALALAVVVLAGWAATALPGDPLYPAKRAAESAWLAALPAGAGQSAAEAAFWRRRADEVRALLAAGRSATVTLQGPIESMTPDAWRLSGLEARVRPGTRVLGTPELGETARAWGRTENGRLWVDTIVCEPPPGESWAPATPAP